MEAELPEVGEQPVRDRLALVRTHLANERTLLAYARTAIMLVATGTTLLTLYREVLFAAAAGWTLIAAGIGVAVVGVTRFPQIIWLFRQRSCRFGPTQ